MIYEILRDELDKICDDSLRAFAEYALSKAPPYFWMLPSSSTGKYHPPQSNGQGGLIRHTKAAVYFADSACRPHLESGSLTTKDHAIAVTATLLHDIVKYGVGSPQRYTTKTHDKEGADFVFRLGREYCKDHPELDLGDIKRVCKGIAFHMGPWTSEDRRKQYPDEYSLIERIVFEADYNSSRREVGLSILEPSVGIG